MKTTKAEMQKEMDYMKKVIAEQQEKLDQQDRYIKVLVAKVGSFREALKEAL